MHDYTSERICQFCMRMSIYVHVEAGPLTRWQPSEPNWKEVGELNPGCFLFLVPHRVSYLAPAWLWLLGWQSSGALQTSRSVKQCFRFHFHILQQNQICSPTLQFNSPWTSIFTPKHNFLLYVSTTNFWHFFCKSLWNFEEPAVRAAVKNVLTTDCSLGGEVYIMRL